MHVLKYFPAYFKIQLQVLTRDDSSSQNLQIVTLWFSIKIIIWKLFKNAVGFVSSNFWDFGLSLSV